MVTAGPAPCKPQDEVHTAGSGLLVWLVSNVVSFAWVRGRPPRPIRYGQPRSRTVADPGGRRSALLESVLGATPREFESRTSATVTCDDALDHVRALRYIPQHVSHFLSQLSPGHMS